VAGVVVGGHPERTGLTRLPDGLRSLVLGDSGRSLADQVLSELERRYYRPIDTERLERDSVEGIVRSLGDPYTFYLTPEELARARADSDGEYSGVGIRIARRDEEAVVSAVFPGSPAERARVRVGDRLVAVDGRSVTGRTLDRRIAGIKGEEGTTVTLRLVRGTDAPRDVELTRATIRVPVVFDRLETERGRKIGYVRLVQFTRGSAEALRGTVRAQLERGARAIVLDLRGDPGGLVGEATGVASVFLPEGAPIVTTRGANESPTTLRASGDPIPSDIPLVVLVDRGSASSSEIVAGALRDAGRARLVGTRTFGKSLVQTTVPLEGGGALRLTTARYVTPKGTDIGSKGLVPDVRVVDDPATRPDEALDRALALAAARATR
jgi:carboxyl-terminal processing protease